MATWYDGVTVLVQIAWDDTPAVAIASRTWTDHSGKVLEFSTDRGTTSEFAGFGPGTCTVTLHDPDRLFDSANTAGAYHGKIQPMRPIRIRVTAGAVTATLFGGFVASIALGYDHDGKVPTATLTCVDGTQVLEGADCPGSAYAAEVLSDSPTHYWPMQDDPTGVVDIVGDADMARYSAAWGDPAGATLSYPLGATGAIAGGALGASNADAALPGTVEFWRTPGEPTDSQQVRVSLDSTNIIGMTIAPAYVAAWYSNSTTNRRADTSWNRTLTSSAAIFDASHIALTADGTTFSVYADGFLVESFALSVGTGTTPNPLGPQPGFSLLWEDSDTARSHFAMYTDALSATDILRHYEAGLYAYGHPYGERGGERIGRVLDAIDWPADDRDLSTGSTALDQWLPGTSSPLAQCREVEEVEQGLFYIDAEGKVAFRGRPWIRSATEAVTAQATFGDQSSEIRYDDSIEPRTDVDFIRNVISVDYAGGTVTTKDATSVSAFGQQRDGVNAGLLPASDGWLARQLANYRLRHRKDARQRIERIKVHARHPDNIDNDALETLIQLDLGYRVTVNRRPPGGTGSISLDLMVLGIRHDVTKAADGWITTLYLAPVQQSVTEAGYMITGTSLTGDTTTSY